MKKRGFTLAEVLITLGIIGVVAAITLPTLMTDTASAQIGPKLAKAVATFEQANESLLNDEEVDKLTDTGYLSNGNTIPDYIANLGKFLKFSTYSQGHTVTGTSATCAVAAMTTANQILSKDGMLYVITRDKTTTNTAQPPHKQRIGHVWIDINAATKPNTVGTDAFVFAWYNDGSLRPVGGTNWNENGDASCKWRTNCANDKVPTDYQACAGAIFENNLKVLYK